MNATIVKTDAMGVLGTFIFSVGFRCPILIIHVEQSVQLITLLGGVRESFLGSAEVRLWLGNKRLFS